MFYYCYFSSFKFHHLAHNFVQCPLIKWTFKQKTYDVGRAPKKKKTKEEKRNCSLESHHYDWWSLTILGITPLLKNGNELYFIQYVTLL